MPLYLLLLLILLLYCMCMGGSRHRDQRKALWSPFSSILACILGIKLRWPGFRSIPFNFLCNLLLNLKGKTEWLRGRFWSPSVWFEFWLSLFLDLSIQGKLLNIIYKIGNGTIVSFSLGDCSKLTNAWHTIALLNC